jgi:hypothetical protein
VDDCEPFVTAGDLLRAFVVYLHRNHSLSSVTVESKDEIIESFLEELNQKDED